MNSGSGEREDWETAGGPVVGKDVPITNEPRDEDELGAPATPDPRQDDDENDQDEGLIEKHESPEGDPGSGTTEESD